VPTRYQILISMRGVLEPRGFKHAEGTFHRATDAGFIDVVNLQAGVGRLVGKSTVNLGIYIPEVWALLGKSDSIQQAREKTMPRETECAIRSRLSTLVYGSRGPERWFDRSDSSVGQTISELLSGYALPWFEKLSSLSSIAEELKADSSLWWIVWGIQAAIFKVSGDLEAARSLLWERRSNDRDPIKVEVFASCIGIDLKSESDRA